MDYASGAIFGCPAHDQRDFDFAKKYKLEILPVVSDGGGKKLEEAYTGKGLMINSDFLDGLDVDVAKEKIANKIETLELVKEKHCSGLRIGEFQGSAIGDVQFL